MYSDQTIKLYIPKELIKNEDEHPEEYGELIVVLDNGMWTDVYTDDFGEYFTLTNDSDLIEYVKAYKRQEKL